MICDFWPFPVQYNLTTKKHCPCEFNLGWIFTFHLQKQLIIQPKTKLVLRPMLYTGKLFTIILVHRMCFNQNRDIACFRKVENRPLSVAFSRLYKVPPPHYTKTPKSLLQTYYGRKHTQWQKKWRKVKNPNPACLLALKKSNWGFLFQVCCY